MEFTQLLLLLLNSPQVAQMIAQFAERRRLEGEEHKLEEDARAMARALEQNDMETFNRIFNS